MIAEVIVNSSANELNRIFDYEIPEEYRIGETIDIGYRVLVPFARRKQLEIGYIIGLKEASDYQCKPLGRVVDRALDPIKVELARWMAKQYFCNVSEVLRLFVPPGTSQQLDKVHVKTERWVRIPEEMCAKIESEVETLKSEKQKKILHFLMDNQEIPVAILVEVTGTSSAVVKALEKKGMVEIFEREVWRNPFFHKHIVRDHPLPLTEAQAKVKQQVALGKFGEYLLYGVTGSGKTELYLQWIADTIASGKTAIVLVPEISLTPQMTDRFLSRFGRTIAILHSKLSQGERFDEWRRIQKGEAKIVIGARSALFAPLQKIGMIIIDEEHDASYKSETTPKYEAREVAQELAKRYQATLIYGSATPDVRTYYRAQQKEIALLELPSRISQNGMPEIQIADMREELAHGNKTVFSRLLYQEIKQNLAKKEQTILFLNRRGYSTFVMCRNCGYVVKCEKCDVSMTYHATKNKLLCHYCGAEKENVRICPSCGSENIRYFGTGTQKIEAEIHRFFPEASVIRMDVDTTTTKNAHEKILQSFRDEKIDILLGTQMITKGHDFENVTLVGVLAADASLHVGDYRANERTFQLLTQVAGRAGRGEKRGRAIVQTYMPDESSILAAQKQDYLSFYRNEINIREKLNFPPFCDIIILVITGTEEKAVMQDAKLWYQLMQAEFETYQAIPAPISKINGNYRWRVLSKAVLDDEKRRRLQYCLDAFETMKTKETKSNFDINPNTML